MGDEQEKKKRVAVESLGWLTESSIMPRKIRAITDVGASSILELKARLYKSKEESKKSTKLSGSNIEYHRAKKKISPHDPFSFKNSGVDARAHKSLDKTISSLEMQLAAVRASKTDNQEGSPVDVKLGAQQFRGVEKLTLLVLYKLGKELRKLEKEKGIILANHICLWPSWTEESSTMNRNTGNLVRREISISGMRHDRYMQSPKIWPPTF